MQNAPTYPVAYEVEPAAKQSRLSVLFRFLLVIPHAILLSFLGMAQAVVTFTAWFAILFIGRYPVGMLGFSTGVIQWSARMNGYVYLLTGRYPPFALGEDAAYPVRLRVAESPDNRNRLTTFFRIFMVIPHLIVLYFLGIALGVAVLIALIVALVTAEVPAGLHNFISGVVRWQLRVNAYGLLLTDEYPPFALD